MVDTIGAGDTVHGALLFWLHRAGITTPDGLEIGGRETAWRDALTFAARAASITVSRAGAEPLTLLNWVFSRKVRCPTPFGLTHRRWAH